MKQGIEKEDVYSSFTILFLSSSPHHLIFSPPHSHLFIFSIYHPLPRSPSFLLFFFFIILLPLENHRERRKYFFLKPNYDFSTVARKRKTLLPIFPRLFFAIFSLRNISPCYIFHERKRNEAG